ncbi:MAG TPA: hypothetical protein VLA98_15820 [Solirubrobacteraceae bacterium]|nr:hypothetical protein [Solirubrobacteraceae bacterium]
MDWTFIYLMVGLKLPILALLWIVWRAVHDTPEGFDDDDQDGGGGDGGVRRAPPHPRRPFPRLPRRGPHGSPPSPPRTRSVLTARARRTERA